MVRLLEGNPRCPFIVGRQHDRISPNAKFRRRIVCDDFTDNRLPLCNRLYWQSADGHVGEDVVFHERIVVSVEVHEPVVRAPVSLLERWNPEPFTRTRMILVIEVSIAYQ